MKSTKLLILFCATFCINSITAKPTEPETSNETSNEQQRIIVDVNTQPEKQDPGMTDFLKNNNLTMEDLMKKQAILRDAAMSASTPQSDGTDDSVSSSQHREIHKALKESALSVIRETIESNVIRNGTGGAEGRHRGETHEIAFTPICDLPKNTTEDFWFDTNTWNLYFKPPAKTMTIVSANLRLYKLAPSADTLPAVNSTEDPLLRITVSAYARKKNRVNGTERKKRICSCTSVASSYEGWIEMDIKLALKLWEKPSKNLGLAIEVQDSEDNYLKAISYFHKHDCQAKYPTFPFNVYRDQVFGAAYQIANMPRYPRVDIMYEMPDDTSTIYHPMYSNNPFRRYRHTQPEQRDAENSSDQSDENLNHRMRVHHQHHNIAHNNQNTQHAGQEHSSGRRSHNKRHLSHKHMGKRVHAHKTSGSHQDFSSDVQENT